MNKKIFFLLFFSTFFIATSQVTRTVDSQSAFDTALSSSVSGDIIEWENGAYEDVFMDVTKDGVTVKAETSGGVIFNGNSRVEIDGDNIDFLGFQYVGGDIGTSHVVRIYGSNILFENVNISEYTSYKYLIVEKSSQYATIKNCNFEHRVNNPDQNIVSILINENQPGFHKIQFCSFKNFDGEPDGSGSVGDAGVEPIRIGVSTTSMYESKSIVEYCYFTQCNGDGEIISHKGTECIYRYNTFENNPESELVLRHGGKGIVYGNFFINGKGGVRIQEASDHLIYNNYFSGQTSRSLNLNASSADKLDNILIAYNTFVETDKIDIESHSTNEATNITIANNVFTNSSDDLFEDVTGDETWIGNIYNGSLGVSLPSSGLTNTNPDLSLNSEGFYTINASSPVINEGEAGYPSLPIFTDFAYDNEVLLDVLGTTRPSSEAMKDIGCQEYDANAILKAHATEENTGPNYLIDPSILSTSNEEIISDNFVLYPNPINDTLNINFSLEEESDVKVDVYDLSGKKIMKLIEASYGIGNHSFNTDLNVMPGFYLVYIEMASGNINATKVEKVIKQ